MKFYNRICLFTSVIVSSATLVSCSISDEFDKLNSIESVEATGSFNANILNETWLLKDLLTSEKLNFKEGADGTYSLGFETTSNYNVDKVKFPIIDDIDPIDIPLTPLNFSSGYINTPAYSSFSLPPFAIDFEIPKPDLGTVSLSEDFKIKNVKLKDGAKITIGLNIQSNSATQITVKIPSLTKNGVGYSRPFDPIVGSTVIDLVIDDLDGYILNAQEKVSISIEPSVVRTPYPISGSITANFNIDISDYNEYVDGFFGEVALPVDNIEFPISLPDEFKGVSNSEMSLDESTMTVTVNKNDFDGPLHLVFGKESRCVYKGDGNSKPITIVPVLEDINNNVYTFKIKNLNVYNVDKLILEPIIILNRDVKSGENKITDASSLQYNISLDLPFSLKAQELYFEQEGDNVFFDDATDESDFQIKDGKIVLKGSIISEIPIGSSIQVFYRNESKDGQYLTPLFDKPFEISKESVAFETTISKEKLDEIKKYKLQVLKVSFNGAGAIKSNQKINIKLGIAVKGTVSSKI